MAERQTIGMPTLVLSTRLDDSETAKALEELRYQTEVILRRLVQEIDVLKGLRGGTGDS